MRRSRGAFVAWSAGPRQAGRFRGARVKACVSFPPVGLNIVLGSCARAACVTQPLMSPEGWRGGERSGSRSFNHRAITLSIL
jgi:hypothetical protein